MLYELTVAEHFLDCNLQEVSTLAELERLTKELHKNSNLLTKGVISTPVLEAAVRVLRPMVVGLGAVEHSALGDMAIFLSALESVLNTVHNLLLFSTDSTMQLRKHVTKIGLFEVLPSPPSRAHICCPPPSACRPYFFRPLYNTHDWMLRSF